MGKESTEYNGLNAISATEKKSKTLNTNYNPNTKPHHSAAPHKKTN